MVRTSSHIQLTGPFFEKDPRKTFRQNVRTMLEAIVAEGEPDVIQQMVSGQSGRSLLARLGDRASDHVIGRTHSLSGKRWALTAVISINNKSLSAAGGKSLMAGAANVERETHAFRRTANRLKRSRAVNLAELTKGLT